MLWPSKISCTSKISTLLTNVFQINTSNSAFWAFPFTYPVISSNLTGPQTNSSNQTLFWLPYLCQWGHNSQRHQLANPPSPIYSFLSLNTQFPSTNTNFFSSFFPVLFCPFPLPYLYNIIFRLPIHSNNCLLSTYYVPSSVLDFGDTSMNRNTRVTVFVDFYILMEL